ncbi:hypothetical protein PU629_16900 [Pullulanibacillus sp. KACC 23026]|uniref:hypothetical protein n=1 Tax=Pullulanibacillus sp. KACC 23026 TaxID=3028315 RepID=UPI0023B1EEAF|nr:hypothetical protein [Pullulanibacillus sp. KACC 23026]WEG11804.1 hypothetical protein PU629_16900 [Pullulanibacillus sp. KACC 23026]
MKVMKVMAAAVFMASIGLGSIAHAASAAQEQVPSSAVKSENGQEMLHQQKGDGHHHMVWLEDAAQVLNMDKTTLFNELKSGKSLADIAKEKGISNQKLKSGLQSALSSRLEEAVKAGRLTTQQRDAILLKASQHMDEWIQHKGLPHWHGKHGGFWLDEASKILNVDKKTLIEKLRSGQSLADIAKEKGMSQADLKAKLLEAQKARLTQAVKDGKINEETKQKIISRTEAHIDQWLTHKRESSSEE